MKSFKNLSSKLKSAFQEISPSYKDATGIQEKNLENNYYIRNKMRGLFPFNKSLKEKKKDQTFRHEEMHVQPRKNDFHEFGDHDRDNVNNKRRLKK
jgi:hypothetical protein